MARSAGAPSASSASPKMRGSGLAMPTTGGAQIASTGAPGPGLADGVVAESLLGVPVRVRHDRQPNAERAQTSERVDRSGNGPAPHFAGRELVQQMLDDVVDGVFRGVARARVGAVVGDPD